MNRTRTLLAFALATLLGLALAQGMMGTPNDPRAPGGGYGNYGNYGMMQPGYGGYGPGGMGMMGPGYGSRGGQGMMGGMGMMGGGMMGGTMMRVLPPDAQPLDDAELRARLDAAARAFGPDVSVDDVMPFTDHSYAQFVGPDGTGLAEVLVDRYTGIVTPEPGPNMMWNVRTAMGGYGMGGFGMNGNGMGPWGATLNTAQQRYDETQARELAATFLAGYLPGADVLASQTFPGYATFDYGRDGRIDGMLSVNLGSGQIWPHTWHGAALASAHD
ncbi:MAG: hypothetical protein WD336_08935 [Trueperaceae bacterium]